MLDETVIHKFVRPIGTDTGTDRRSSACMKLNSRNSSSNIRVKSNTMQKYRRWHQSTRSLRRSTMIAFCKFTCYVVTVALPRMPHYLLQLLCLSVCLSGFCHSKREVIKSSKLAEKYFPCHYCNWWCNFHIESQTSVTMSTNISMLD